jgi:tRNA (guanosine-2'-O-)-methyltransferase
MVHMTEKRTHKISRVLSHRQQGIVVLEDIHDPHNAAAVLRSMDAFGFQTVHFVFAKEKAYNPKRIGKQSSASANKWLTIEVFPSTAECYARLKSNGYTIYATALGSTKPLNLYDSLPTLGPKIALIFGNEHAGISEYARDHANYHLYIPMVGFVQSFNISVSVALTLGEITRKRMGEGMEKYLITESQKKELTSRWI